MIEEQILNEAVDIWFCKNYGYIGNIVIIINVGLCILNAYIFYDNYKNN
jgi:hypothetical protein